MVLTTDDFVKIALTLAVVFSLVGISWQIMRILNGLVDTVKESNLILVLAHDFMEKFSEDYDFIIEQVKSVLDGVSGLSNSIFKPLANIFGFLKKLESMPFVGGKKGKKDDSEE